jgi:hypothetical protein
LVTDEFNAAVVTLPRIGLFGRKVYLLVGLPLMHALSADQFKAVLAHEIGHISEKHGSFAKWAYQLREAWGRLIESQEAHDHKFSALYEKFVAWFFPYFTAYSFVLMREHEKDADRHAVQLTGERALGDALVTLETRGVYVEDVFWKKVHEENVAGGEPPKELFSGMLESLALVEPQRDLVTLEKALKVPTDYHDSHPSLGERLQLMGYWTGHEMPDLPRKVEVTAAQYFLGDEIKTHIRDFNSDWDEKIRQGWQSRFEGYQKGDKRIAELDAKAADDHLSVEEMIEKAGLIADKKGSLAALPLVREIVTQHPDHAEANYFLGGILLGNDDEEGLQYVHKAIDLDHKWAYAGSSVAFQYLRSKGRLEEAKRYAAAMEEQEDVIVKAEAERKWVNPTDELDAYSLGPDAVEAIVSKMKYYDEIERIYLARKKVEYFKEIPFHILCFDLKKTSRFSRGSQLSSHEILKIAGERLTGFDIGFFLTLDGSYEPMKTALEKLPGAKIFERVV